MLKRVKGVDIPQMAWVDPGNECRARLLVDKADALTTGPRSQAVSEKYPDFEVKNW